MPIENQPVQPSDQPQDEAGWRQLAQEAAQWPAHHEGLQLLREGHVNRLLGQKGLGHLVVNEEDKAGARFLHEHGALNPKEVGHVVGYLRQNGAIIPQKVGDRTAAYLDFMADTKVVNDGIVTGDQFSIERQIDARVIKAEDVPESYFALQRRIAREQGYGDIEVTPEMRRQLIEAIRADQRGSLEKWVEYLGGDDGSYPNWFKRYTWDSVTRLGLYDKKTRKFGRREAGTVAPYPDLNREALAYVYDTVKKFHVLGKAVDDAELKLLLKEASFGRLYAHAILEVTPDSPESRKEIRGSWTQFHQSDDPRTARRLSGSLQGHGTGWCTAGESTAANQLKAGDFYVYYTRDEDGKDTVPRVAIRMQNGEVAEVRGIDASQELEPAMADITSEQLKGLPGAKEYIIRAADMKRLTALDNLLTSDPAAKLSADDVAFLYELNRTIQGFGYDEDPRVKELQRKAASAGVADTLENLQGSPELAQRMRNYIHIRLLSDLASQQPEVEFSDEDLRFIYGLNGPIDSLDPEDTNELAKSIDYWHGGRDRERLLQLIPEALTSQYQTSFAAYEAVSEGLDVQAASEEAARRAFEAKRVSWQNEGVYHYILEQLIENDTQFTLIATPNVLASHEQVAEAAKIFGKNQPYETYVYGDLYSQYSPEELSGKQLNNSPVRFSLMPNRVTQEIESAPVDEQRSALERLQQRLPRLDLHVPSVLDAISYWQTLRAHGDALAGNGALNKTQIRHFDLPEKSLLGVSYVPRSCVSYDGGPGLLESRAQVGGDARVLVG